MGHSSWSLGSHRTGIYKRFTNNKTSGEPYKQENQRSDILNRETLMNLISKRLNIRFLTGQLKTNTSGLNVLSGAKFHSGVTIRNNRTHFKILFEKLLNSSEYMIF